MHIAPLIRLGGEGEEEEDIGSGSGTVPSSPVTSPSLFRFFYIA
jgi:hypothetical protein